MSEPQSKMLHLDGTVQEQDNSLVDDKSDYEFWSKSELQTVKANEL